MLFVFIPYVVIGMLFFMPIPIAVLFDSFRKERADIIVTDLLKQKQSLMFCFICLDVDKDNLVDLATFKAMMDYAFNHRLSEENILEVYKSVCPDLTKKINAEKFTSIAYTMQNRKFFKLEPLRFWPWEK